MKFSHLLTNDLLLAITHSNIIQIALIYYVLKARPTSHFYILLSQCFNKYSKYLCSHTLRKCTHINIILKTADTIICGRNI